MTTPVHEGNYVLGIRLGVGSLGWAALSLNNKGEPAGILALGTRKFPVGAQGDTERGRETGPNERRREARAIRTRLARRVGRLRAVWDLLQGASLLPAGRFKDRDAMIKNLDRGIDRHPYVLRARALDAPLQPHELGRALYHLAQRRGFQSNRRAAAKPDEKLGVVKQGITDLDQLIREAGARTLGEYLAKRERHTALRRRWTARDMYRAEFNAIASAQVAHHPVLTSGFLKKLTIALFSQRPLQSQARRVGRCDLEPSKRRTALATLEAQEFRVLCRVNDLRLVDDLGVAAVELTDPQRAALFDCLRNGDATFPAVRKALGLPRSVRFNAERIDDEKLIGFRTHGKMRAALGAAWSDLTPDRQAALIEDMLTIDEDAALARRLERAWGLGDAAVSALLGVTLEPSFAGLSRKAIRRLLPLLRQGVPYATARKQLYPKADDHIELRSLPRIDVLYRALPNPLVRRALSELRVVANALCAQHGRPRTMHVSLMRELRIGRKARERLWIKMRVRHKQRAGAAARLLEDLGVQEPPRWMVDKILLADECGWKCPFTGKTIAMRALVGDQSRFEVVHIVPFHVSLDDGFENKTLCHVSIAAQLQTVGPAAQVDAKALARFEALEGPYAKEKLRRIKLTPEEIAREFEEESIAERFVDSCYASKLAVDMLSRFYPPSRVGVTAVRGAITAYLREGAGLYRIELPSGSFRRATVDAVAVALAGPKAVRRLSAAAKSALPGRRRLNPEQVTPWLGFNEAVRDGLEKIIVSSRVRRKVSGALHEETFYRRVGEINGRMIYEVHKHLWQLAPGDVLNIRGREVRKVIEAKLAELKQADPRKAFAKPENLPQWRGSVVRRVRLERHDTLFTIGKKGFERHVAVERNHHAVVYMRRGRSGTPMADQAIVSQFEAQRRSATRLPIVQRPGDKCAGLGTLSPSEIIDCRETGEGLQTVRSISAGHPIAMTGLDDGRKLNDITEAKAWLRRSVEQLRIKGARKVTITPLGEVRRDGT